MMGGTSGVGTAYPSGAPEFTPWIFVSVVHVVKSLVLCIMFCKSLFVFFFAIIWSVLRQFTTSNNHFAVFKLFMWKSK
jgi:hypothetical protein